MLQQRELGIAKTEKGIRKLREYLKKQFLFPLFGWILLWVIPWGKMLEYEGNIFLTIISDIIRLSVAISLFLLPGIFFYLLLSRTKQSLSVSFTLIPIGFTFSTLLIGLIGLAGRLLGFSFELVKFIFAFIGLVELFALTKIYPKLFSRNSGLYNGLRESLNNPPLLAALFFGILFLINASLFFIDDWTYLAYLTDWQHSTHLDFTEIIFGTTSTDLARFWLALYPMGQALLSDLSGVPGILLLGHYLEIFLVMIAILAMYYFFRTLGLSRRSAGFSVLVHIALLGWIVGGGHNPVGFWFLLHMAEDKVSAAFILAPVLFSLLFNLINRPDKQNYWLVLLAGIGLTLTHPIILFYVDFIVCGVVILSWLMRRITWVNLIKIILGILIWTLPYVVVRFSNHPSIATIPYDAEQAEGTLTVDILLNIRNDGLYGMDPEVLMFLDANVSPDIYIGYQWFRSIPIIITMIAGLIALAKIKQGNVYLYIFMSVTIVFLALIPHTGRLLGYIIGARMLFRASWFAPLGLGVVASLKVCADFIAKSISFISSSNNHRWLEKTLTGLYSRLPMLGFTFFIMVGLASPSVWLVTNHAPILIPTWNFYRQLADVGDYMSKNNSKKVTVITLNDTDDFLPGVSAKAIPVTFREESGTAIHYFFTDQEFEERKNESDMIQSLDPLIPIRNRIPIIKKYKVKYILADTWQADQFMTIMNSGDKLIEPVFRTDDFVLFEVRSSVIGD